MAAKLVIVRKPQPPEPPEALVQEATDRIVNGELAQFADRLHATRTMWRLFKDLVEQPEFPLEFRSVYANEFGVDPDDDSITMSGVDALDPGFRQVIRPRAIEIARKWMKADGATHKDKNSLSGLGVAG
jgi:hypothetical protein